MDTTMWQLQASTFKKQKFEDWEWEVTYLLSIYLVLFINTKWLQDYIYNMVHGLCFCKTAYKHWKEGALGHLYLEVAKFLSGSSVICEVYLTQFATLLFFESETFPSRVGAIASTLKVEVPVLLSFVLWEP